MAIQVNQEFPHCEAVRDHAARAPAAHRRRQRAGRDRLLLGDLPRRARRDARSRRPGPMDVRLQHRHRQEEVRRAMAVRMGIDIGGTFTDLALFDEESGHVHVTKAASTPGEPHRAVNAVINKAGIDNATIPRPGTRHDRGHQRPPGAQDATAGVDNHPWLQRRGVHPEDEPQAPLRPAVGQADPVRGAAALPGGGRALQLQGRDRRAAGRGGGTPRRPPAARRGALRHRRVLPVLLRQPGQRAAHA